MMNGSDFRPDRDTTSPNPQRALEASALDPRRAFGATDPHFAARVRNTLGDLRSREAASPTREPRASCVSRVSHRRTRRALLVAAAVFVTLSFGTAFAATNGFGLLERISNPNAGAALPEAQDLVVSGSPQHVGVLPQATFTLDEFLYDGETLWVSVTARPSSPQYVMTRGNETLAQDAKELLNGQEVPFDQTLSSWAVENGYSPFSTTLQLHLAQGEAPYGGGYNAQFLEDGSIVYVLTATGIQLEPGQEMRLVCALSPYLASEGRFDFANREETTLGFTIDEIPVLPLVASSQPIDFAEAGIVVDYVELSSSPLATYCEAEFTVVDEERFASYNGGLFFRILDANGQQYLGGLGSGGALLPIPGDEGRYRYHDAIQAMEELPTEIQLRLFDLNNGKQPVETQSIPLS